MTEPQAKAAAAEVLKEDANELVSFLNRPEEMPERVRKAIRIQIKHLRDIAAALEAP